MRIAWRLLIVVLLLITASCATGSTDSTSSASATDTTASNTQESAADDQSETPMDEDAGGDDTDADNGDDDDEPAVNEQEVSPIGAALGFDPSDQLEANNNYIRDAEELVRQCMAEAGFEYLPLNPGFAQSFQRQLELEGTLSVDQFREQYGFGISTLFELNFQGEGVLAFVERLLGPPPTEERSPSEQEAYELALSGESVQGLTAEEIQEQAFQGGPSAEGSCRRYGYDTAENPQGEIFDGFISLLGDELETFGDQFEADPRVREAVREWQGCMAAAGYAYDNENDIRDEINEKANDIGERLTQSPEALEIFAGAIDAGLTTMDADARFDWLEQAGAMQGMSMVPALQAELDELIAFELDIARINHECGDAELMLEVQFELEQQFVETHADQFALIVSGQAEG